MDSRDKLLAELEVATRIAGTTTDPQTAREVRRYMRELEGRMRDFAGTTVTVSI